LITTVVNAKQARRQLDLYFQSTLDTNNAREVQEQVAVVRCWQFGGRLAL